MSTEIIINPEKLIDAENKLNKLQTTIGNKKASVSFTSSKGETVDNLIELAKRMEDAKNKIALLYGNTSSALAATRASFRETDNSIANYFNAFWERTDEK